MKELLTRHAKQRMSSRSEGVVLVLKAKGSEIVMTVYRNKNFTKKFRGYHV